MWRPIVLLPVVLAAGCGAGGWGDGELGGYAGPTDAGSDSGTREHEPPEGCDDLPQGPFEYRPMPKPFVNEDLAFDDVGNIVGNAWDRPGIFKTPPLHGRGRRARRGVRRGLAPRGDRDAGTNGTLDRRSSQGAFVRLSARTRYGGASVREAAAPPAAAAKHV